MTDRKAKLSQLHLRSGHRLVLLDRPPMGHLQAVVLKTLIDMGPGQSGQDVLEELSVRVGYVLDHALIYGAIRKLVDSGYLAEDKAKRPSRKGPPHKILIVTDDGIKALGDTCAHHQEVVAFLDGASPAEKEKAAKADTVLAVLRDVIEAVNEQPTEREELAFKLRRRLNQALQKGSLLLGITQVNRRFRWDGVKDESVRQEPSFISGGWQIWVSRAEAEEEYNRKLKRDQPTQQS